MLEKIVTWLDSPIRSIHIRITLLSMLLTFSLAIIFLAGFYKFNPALTTLLVTIASFLMICSIFILWHLLDDLGMTMPKLKFMGMELNDQNEKMMRMDQMIAAEGALDNKRFSRAKNIIFEAMYNNFNGATEVRLRMFLSGIYLAEAKETNNSNLKKLLLTLANEEIIKSINTIEQLHVIGNLDDKDKDDLLSDAVLQKLGIKYNLLIINNKTTTKEIDAMKKEMNKIFKNYPEKLMEIDSYFEVNFKLLITKFSYNISFSEPYTYDHFCKSKLKNN